jgi:hypothetical protein
MLGFAGIIIHIIITVIDHFIFEIPAPIYIIIQLIVIFLLIKGLWIRKQERDKSEG